MVIQDKEPKSAKAWHLAHWSLIFSNFGKEFTLLILLGLEILVAPLKTCSQKLLSKLQLNALPQSEQWLPLLKRPKSIPSEASFFLRLPKPFFRFAKEINSTTPFTYSWQKKEQQTTSLKVWKMSRKKIERPLRNPKN